jgi:hypothetical protein
VLKGQGHGFDRISGSDWYGPSGIVQRKQEQQTGKTYLLF